jgi:hypothetical protein
MRKKNGSGKVLAYIVHVIFLSSQGMSLANEEYGHPDTSGRPLCRILRSEEYRIFRKLYNNNKLLYHFLIFVNNLG